MGKVMGRLNCSQSGMSGLKNVNICKGSELSLCRVICECVLSLMYVGQVVLKIASCLKYGVRLCGVA